ncbi:MAG: hypothetical protein WCG23_09180 [bacterium]
MFYNDTPDISKLRFGDIVKGNYLTSLFYSSKCNTDIFKLEVNIAEYNVILTPCCSIQTKEDLGNIIITPLIQIKPSFYSNPYFAENMLNINKIISPQNQVPPEAWEKMPEEEKQKRLEEGSTYAFKEYFIYAPHDYYSKYYLDSRSGKIVDINYYMIDFRNAFNIKVEKIKSPENILLKSKVLELSIDSRKELNDKLQAFYRIPDEDLD